MCKMLYMQNVLNLRGCGHAVSINHVRADDAVTVSAETLARKHLLDGATSSPLRCTAPHLHRTCTCTALHCTEMHRTALRSIPENTTRRRVVFLLHVFRE